MPESAQEEILYNEEKQFDRIEGRLPWAGGCRDLDHDSDFSFSAPGRIIFNIPPDFASWSRDLPPTTGHIYLALSPTVPVG